MRVGEGLGGDEGEALGSVVEGPVNEESSQARPSLRASRLCGSLGSSCQKRDHEIEHRHEQRHREAYDHHDERYEERYQSPNAVVSPYRPAKAL